MDIDTRLLPGANGLESSHRANAAAGPSRLPSVVQPSDSIDLTGDSDDDAEPQRPVAHAGPSARTPRPPPSGQGDRAAGSETDPASSSFTAQDPSDPSSSRLAASMSNGMPQALRHPGEAHANLGNGNGGARADQPGPGPSGLNAGDYGDDGDHGDDGDIEVTGANIVRSPSTASHIRPPHSNGMSNLGHPPYAGFSPYAAPGGGHCSPYAFQGAPPSYPAGMGYGNGYPPPGPSGLYGPGAGSSSASAIDLTNAAIRSPPPPAKSSKPICLGAFDGRAYLLYPSPAVKIGAQAPAESKDRYEVVTWRGTEFLRVRLKFRPSEGMIQVLIPGSNTYIGDLEPHLQSILVPHLAKGLCRLDGFAVRLHEEAAQFEIKINIMVFTLPANISYITESLVKNTIFFFDPLPPYDAARHADEPRYLNPHGGQEIAAHLHNAAQSRLRHPNGSFLTAQQQAQMDKAKALEVSRVQVDQVYDSLDNAAELEQSDPGPLIKTELFPHQRKALTFFLQREHDNHALKRARKYADKATRKSKKEIKSAGTSVDGDADVKSENAEAESTEGKSKDRGKGRESQLLWEAKCDDKGRTKTWKCRITDEERRAKKGNCPNDVKGAILADDMGLGKTLSVVSLIAATRQSAKKWGKSKLNATTEDEEEKPTEDSKPGIKATGFAGRVFGMPSVESDDDSSSKGKKRKRDETDKRNASLRQTRLSRRSKATLLLCPMSTISNWEDQIKEHWNGKVEVVGGAAGIMPNKVPEKKWKPPKKDDELSSDEGEDFDTLKVYIYHGSSRRADPSFIADFDVVITSYNTLAQEFTKMNATLGDDETASATPAETAANSEDDTPVDGLMDVGLNERQTKPDVEDEIKANEVVDALRKPKGKRKGRVSAKTGADPISALQAIEWFRVVLDEAHYIKSAVTVASKASCYLAADRRIALTGTPIQNKIEDVWALFKFLRLDPVDRKDVFNEYIWDPCKRGDPVGVARLQLVMRCCTLRRTKDSTAEDGRKILNLPPRREIQLWLDLREDERAAYDERVDKTKKIVKDLKDQNLMGKGYASVLLEVLRLRQICDHVDLAQLGAVEEDYDGTLMDYDVAIKGIETNGLNLARAQSVVAYLKDGDGAACAKCNYDYSESFPSFGLVDEDKEDRSKLKKLPHKPILTKCLHLYCPRCFKSDIYSDYSKRMKESAGRQCSACNQPLRIPTDVIEVVPPDSPEAEQADQAAAATKRATRKKYVRPPGEKPNLSTKMMYLQQQLMEASRRNPHSVHYDAMAVMRQEAENNDEGLEVTDSDGKPIVTKSVVFSQWTTMLDRIADMLDECQIRYARLDGTMTREERARATAALRINKKVEVLLVSTRAGGVGLNLTAACRCFLVDPYWNPSVEAQAIDRIHRMGQKRPVTAIKLMIKDSIEEKLDQIQKKKASLAQLSLKTMSRKELMEQKTEELASLFS